MIASQSAVDQFTTAFNIFEQNLNGENGEAIHNLRRKAMERFTIAGIPLKKDEQWRFTNIQEELKKQDLVYANNAVSDIEAVKKQVLLALIPDWAGAQLVVVNGVYRPELSNLPEMPSGLDIHPLAKDQNQNWFLQNLETNLTEQKDAFNLLNTAFLTNGLIVETSKNFTADFPVHILYVNQGQGFRMHKNFIHLAENSNLTLLESFSSLAETRYFSNVATHIRQEQNSRVEYYKLQNESTQALHISELTIQQKKDTSFRAQSIDLGGSMVRNNLSVYLDGPGAEATLNGLYLGAGTQHMDNHTVIEHTREHCNSHELYQGILSEESRGVFSGMIHVHPNAQKTDAKQSNNCLLLSDQAKIDSKPQLEIYADDVACTHGATVGQLNEEEIFYLRSRGINKEAARHILTYAFAEKIIEQIDLTPLKLRVEEMFRKKLGKQIQL